MKIDFSQMKTAAALKEEAIAERQDAAKRECKRRITAVLSETAQLNLAADAATGRMSATDLEALVAWRLWVDEMCATWPKVAEVSAPVIAEGLWPKTPETVIALSNRT